MSTTPSGLVSPDTPSGSPAAPEASPPPCQAPDTIPTFITPSVPTTIPPVWEHVIAVLLKLPPSTAEGQNMRSWVLYYSLTSLEDFLMWELDMMPSPFAFLQGTQASLILWFPSNPTPLGTLSCSGSISSTWFRTPTSLWPLMPQIMS